jgi:signal transduction histidine kinase
MLEKANIKKDLSQALVQDALTENAILDTLSDACFLLNSEGVITYANSATARFFSGQGGIGQKIDACGMSPRLSKAVLEALAENEAIVRPVILSDRETSATTLEQTGESAWLVDAAPVQSGHSQSSMRVLLRDITTEHHTEQVRKDFVANASHELRTPLAIINGYLENLTEGDLLKDQETALRFLKIMGKHGRRIARIVEDMLIISRLESGEANTLKIKPFSLKSCALDVVERLESVITTQGASVHLQMEVPEVRLAGDRFYWTQILFNLVENALKQNPQVPLAVTVGWREKESGLVIWVEDNGIGIPSSDLPFIFRRFYRVEKHHSQEGIKGTGLGLSIVRRAVEAHDGTIEAGSIPGEATRFQITLPPKMIFPQDKAISDSSTANS